MDDTLPHPAEAIVATQYDGVDRSVLAKRLELPLVVAYTEVSSTLDAAHLLAANGAPEGTLVLAESQTAGRGRAGRAWSSESGKGIWLTLIERPVSRASLEVLSLRVGLAAAAALDAFTDEPIRLKWPNDLYVDGKKLGGILIEVRWRDERPEWVTIGFGINVVPPADQPNAIGLSVPVNRTEILRALVPGIRTAAQATGVLSAAELEAYSTRDMARGKRCIEPLRGRVRGITPSGELLVELADSLIAARSGSLILE